MRRGDWVGKRYGRLVVKEVLPCEHYQGVWQQTRALCQCDCGEEVIVTTNNLRSGNTRSCGCLRRGVSP